MYLPSDRFRPRPRSRSQRTGFTLVEVLVATAVLGLVAGGALWALTQANNYASISRLCTGAENAAQNQIDFALTDGPFNPQSAPPELGSLPVPPDTTPPIWTLGQSAAKTVIIYTEPAGVNGQTHSVSGQMVTTVTKYPLTVNGSDLNLYSATVVITYTFRSKNYRVQLNAMRASDV
jgi:prepilin-type N-terminal cleavage/methylation domain-containing protein